MFCRHQWKKDYTYTEPSGFEKAASAGLTNIKHASSDFFQSRHLVVYRCDKCGKLKAIKL